MDNEAARLPAVAEHLERVQRYEAYVRERGVGGIE
jgi:hypothetical protein